MDLREDPPEQVSAAYLRAYQFRPTRAEPLWALAVPYRSAFPSRNLGRSFALRELGGYGSRPLTPWLIRVATPPERQLPVFPVGLFRLATLQRAGPSTRIGGTAMGKASEGV